MWVRVRDPDRDSSSSVLLMGTGQMNSLSCCRSGSLHENVIPWKCVLRSLGSAASSQNACSIGRTSYTRAKNMSGESSSNTAWQSPTNQCFGKGSTVASRRYAAAAGVLSHKWRLLLGNFQPRDIAGWLPIRLVEVYLDGEPSLGRSSTGD